MHSEVFTKILTDARLLDALQDVMGTENIALHHTKAHNKPPKKGAPYPMHQVPIIDEKTFIHPRTTNSRCRWSLKISVTA